MNSWSKYRTTDRCGRLGCPKKSTSDSRVSSRAGGQAFAAAGLTETGDSLANLKRLVVFQHGDCGLPSATCEPVTKRGRGLVFSDRREDGGLSQQQHSSRGSRAGMSEHSLPDLLCDRPCYLLCATYSSAGCVLVETFVVTGIRREPAVPVANLAKGAGLASRPLSCL